MLSVKVQELVFEKKKTTYKDVANELINMLTKNDEMKDFLLTSKKKGDDDFEEEEIEQSEESEEFGYKKRSFQEKQEKNVRRRVYDALNVLYAAGVLQKHGKNVYCEGKYIHRQPIQNDKGQKVDRNELLRNIENSKERIQTKQSELLAYLSQILALENLIYRNKKFAERNANKKSV